jgi:general secretion pathway protein K
MVCRTKTVDKDMAESKTQNGIALLIVLWTVTILMVIGLSFAQLVRTELNASINFGTTLENQLLAEAGLERALAEIVYRFAQREKRIPIDARDYLKTDGTWYEGTLGRGCYRFRIIDESGKLNINKLTDRSGIILINFLLKKGVSSEMAETVVDSILDWKDEDELHRLNGAESDYYQLLPTPYKAKNADFETLEELLQVRGISDGMLFGEGDFSLIDTLSVHAPGNKINLLSAPRNLIAAIPGISLPMADRILELRNGAEDMTETDIRAILGDNYPEAVSDIYIGESDVFTIEAVGNQKNEKKKYTIRAIVKMLGDGQYIYLYYKNPSG